MVLLSEYGDGYGAGGGAGAGAGDGYGYGDGYGGGAGYVAVQYDGKIRIGCHVHLASYWLEHGWQIAKENSWTLSRAQAAAKLIMAYRDAMEEDQ